MNLRPRHYTSLATLSVGLLLFAAVGCSGGNDGPGITDIPPDATVVEMPGNAFSPDNVIIKLNGVVAFDFPGAEHDVTFSAKAGAPANIPVTSRQVVTRTFATVGVFPYECKVHPGMVGQVTVTQ
jgi:plastocyanin